MKLSNLILMLVLTLSASFALTGCASMFMPAYTDDGSPVYQYEETDPKTGETEVVFTTSPKHPETGEELEPARTGELKPGFGIFATIGSIVASLFPGSAPFAPLIPELVTLFGVGAAAILGKRKFDSTKADKDSLTKVTNFLMEGFEELKEKAKKGGVSLEDIKKMLVERGGEFIEPEMLDALVQIASSSLPMTEKERLMQEALREFAKAE